MSDRACKRIVLVGTGTGVGKTHVGCALLRALGERGIPAIGLKPVETGVPPLESGSGELSDQQRLWEATVAFHVKHSASPAFHVKRSLYAFPQPISPHLAARISGQRIDLGAIRRWIEEQIAPIVVVETAGGLFSPLGPGLTNADLANALRPSAVLLVGADRLGALHDVTAALGLASARGIAIHGTVLCASQQPDSSTGSNAGELARLGIARPIATFPRASAEDPASLAAAECLLAALL